MTVTTGNCEHRKRSRVNTNLLLREKVKYAPLKLVCPVFKCNDRMSNILLLINLTNTNVSIPKKYNSCTVV